MQNNFIFSYIIAFRYSPERLLNLKKVINWILAFKGCELIIVEQDKEQHLNEIYIPGTYVFVKSNLPFIKSNAFNVGLRYATTPNIVFGDSDLIMEPSAFISAINSLMDYDMVNPYNNVIDLTTDESELQLEELFKINRDGRGMHDNQKVPLCGGINMYRIDAIHKIGGWNEDFIGWGCEDDFQSIKVKKFLKYKEMGANGYHLYHTRPTPDINLYKRNLNILNELSKASDEQLINMINIQNKTNGLKNRLELYE